MALHISTSIRTRHPSRRDHVLNLLPPLTVANKDDATMHERLFADNPPQKNYPENFPSKVLRHLGAWTFYSAPTKGELALLDKNMFDLENEMAKTLERDAVTKQNSGHAGHKTEKKTQSHYDDDGKKKLEANKGKGPKANRGKQFQRKKKEEKTSDKETNVRMEQEKSCLTPKLKKEKCGKSNALQKTKQPVSGDRNYNVDDVKKINERRLKRATGNQQKNGYNQVNTTSLALIAKTEITLKRTRGKVLGGAETGAEISTEELTVEGHNVSVPGPDPRINGKSYKNVEGAHAHGDSGIKANITEVKESKSRKASHGSNLDMYTPVSRDGQTVIIENTDKTTSRNKKRSVIKIPLQENESPESQEKMPQNAMNREMSSENLCSKFESDTLRDSNKKNDMLYNSNSKCHVLCDTRDALLNSNPVNDILRDKRVTFGVSREKQPVNKKRPKSQNGRRKGHKQNQTKNRVKTG